MNAVEEMKSTEMNNQPAGVPPGGSMQTAGSGEPKPLMPVFLTLVIIAALLGVGFYYVIKTLQKPLSLPSIPVPTIVVPQPTLTLPSGGPAQPSGTQSALPAQAGLPTLSAGDSVDQIGSDLNGNASLGDDGADFTDLRNQASGL